jgi:CHAD domain-containing protein
MAYRLRPRESVARGLRRLAKKELQSARDELQRTNPPRDEAIHEARKSIKKVRTIAKLIDADDGRGVAKDRKRLRKVSRTLSQLRDADAMLEILAKLEHRNPQLFDEHTFARLRHRLTLHRQQSMKAARGERAWKTVDREMEALLRGTKRWRPTHRQFRALAAGIRATYRKGRKSMARARKRQRAADFHEWRKELKTLWYELRLVECGPAIRREVRALHRAERWLGEDHNVVLLCGELSKDPAPCDIERLRHAAARYQCELRRKAITTTKRIYDGTGAEYARRLRRAWKHWHRRDTRARVRKPRRAAA